MPPRTAYSPASRTVPVRTKPLISSQATSASMSTMLPGAAEKRLRRDAAARRHALHDGVDGGRQDARARLRRARAGEPRQRRHALRRDAGVRRHAVVGLAVPGREARTSISGATNAARSGAPAGAEPVARDVDQHRRPVRRAGERPREVGDDERVEAVRHARQRRLVAPLKGVEGSGKGGVMVSCHVHALSSRGSRSENPGPMNTAALKLAPTVVMGSGLDASRRPGMTSRVDRRVVGVEALQPAEDGRVVARRRLGLAREPR